MGRAMDSWVTTIGPMVLGHGSRAIMDWIMIVRAMIDRVMINRAMIRLGHDWSGRDICFCRPWFRCAWIRCHRFEIACLQRTVTEIACLPRTVTPTR